MKFDYVVVGAGLFGSVIAEQLSSNGKKVLILDERKQIGGNCSSTLDLKTNTIIHDHGIHIFHTSDKEVWEYMNKFSEFNQYRHLVYANVNNIPISLPFNLQTFLSIYGTANIHDISYKLKCDGVGSIPSPKNLEEQAITSVGRIIYNMLIRGYTIKQWDLDPRELPAEILKRLPIRNSFDNSYYNDRYQGCPIDGYTAIFHRLLQNSIIMLGVRVDSLQDIYRIFEMFLKENGKIIFTGCLDTLLYGYELHTCPIRLNHDEKAKKLLAWRTAKHYNVYIDEESFQGCGQTNYPILESSEPNILSGAERKITRTFEYKYIHPERKYLNTTLIQTEWTVNGKFQQFRDYPIETPHERKKYQDIKNKIIDLFGNRILIGGRLGDYKYYNMDITVRNALDLAKKIMKREG